MGEVAIQSRMPSKSSAHRIPIAAASCAPEYQLGGEGVAVCLRQIRLKLKWLEPTVF